MMIDADEEARAALEEVWNRYPGVTTQRKLEILLKVARQTCDVTTEEMKSLERSIETAIEYFNLHDAGHNVKLSRGLILVRK